MKYYVRDYWTGAIYAIDSDLHVACRICDIYDDGKTLAEVVDDNGETVYEPLPF